MTRRLNGREKQAKTTYRTFMSFYNRMGWYPTVRELGSELGITSSNTAYKRAVNAANFGYLVHRPGRTPAFIPVSNEDKAKGKLEEIRFFAETVDYSGCSSGDVAQRVLEIIAA